MNDQRADLLDAVRTCLAIVNVSMASWAEITGSGKDIFAINSVGTDMAVLNAIAEEKTTIMMGDIFGTPAFYLQQAGDQAYVIMHAIDRIRDACMGGCWTEEDRERLDADILLVKAAMEGLKECLKEAERECVIEEERKDDGRG